MGLVKGYSARLCGRGLREGTGLVLERLGLDPVAKYVMIPLATEGTQGKRQNTRALPRSPTGQVHKGAVFALPLGSPAADHATQGAAEKAQAQGNGGRFRYRLRRREDIPDAIGDAIGVERAVVREVKRNRPALPTSAASLACTGGGPRGYSVLGNDRTEADRAPRAIRLGSAGKEEAGDVGVRGRDCQDYEHHDREAGQDDFHADHPSASSQGRLHPSSRPVDVSIMARRRASRPHPLFQHRRYIIPFRRRL